MQKFSGTIISQSMVTFKIFNRQKFQWTKFLSVNLTPEVTRGIGEPLPKVKNSRYYNYDVSSA